MENHIGQQALTLALSWALGAVCAMFYDLLRSVRLRRRRSKPLTHALDAVYALAVLVLALWLAVAVGGGQLRLYMLTGAGAGALLWWLWPGRALRPAWDFWLDAAADVLHWLLGPLRWLVRQGGKVRRFCKRVFSFGRKPAIMEPESHREEG